MYMFQWESASLTSLPRTILLLSKSNFQVMTYYVAGLIRLSLNIVLFIFSSDPEFDETEPYNRALMFYVDNLSMGNTEHANSLNPNLQQMPMKVLTPV